MARPPITRAVLPQFGTPPDEYDKNYMLTLIASLGALQSAVAGPREVLASSATLLSVPQSGAGLKPGQVWVDGNGFLKLVRSNDVFAAGQLVGARVGQVGVTIV